MKKIACIALAALCLALSGCSFLDFNGMDSSSTSTGSVDETTGSGDSSTGDGESLENGGHEHAFVEYGRVAADCTKDEKIVLVCACGASKTEKGTSALGHDYGEEGATTRILPCKREGCSSMLLPGGGTKKRECTFSAQTKTEMDNEYNALLDILKEVGAYQAGEHGYVEGSALFEKNKDFTTAFNAYKGKITDLGAQYQYGQLAYHLDMNSASIAQTYHDVQQYYNTARGYYYGLYQKIYDSALRNYFYHGDEEGNVQEMLKEYGGRSDTELLELENANVELEMRFYALENPASDSEVLDIYEQFVANNNQIATLSGYENYMAYAYAEDYGREYSYTEIDGFYAYVKEYLAPLYLLYDQKMKDLNGTFTQEDYDEYMALNRDSFFTALLPNEHVHDFMGLVSLNKGETTLSYGEKLDALITNGDYYLGQYQGAYAWRLQKEGVPILYFGPNYQDAFTVVHEFGHYMNYHYNGSRGGSFDLMETHSQGLEMLFLGYLNGKMRPKAYEMLKVSALNGSLRTILYATSVNEFERAVYTNTYAGVNHETIMQDGKITKDEYDLLYQSIQADLGIDGIAGDSYWRHVTVGSPAYYISYALSMSCSLQLLSFAETEGLQSAIGKYLQTVVYTDEHADWNYKQVLDGAGLYAYDDERLFLALQEYLTTE